MKLHANARTCPKSRRLLVERVEEQGWSLTAAAEAAGVSERTAAQVARPLARRGRGRASRSQLGSAAGARPQLPAERVRAIEALRRLRMTAAEIAECLGMALSTVSRWLKRIGLGKRSRLEPPEPPNRYERKRPGELVHVDVKKLGRIRAAPGIGSPATASSQISDRARRPRLGAAGWEFVHVCVDDATRLAYVEVLADERGETAAGFLRRAVAWFAIDGDHGRAGDERQRLLLSLRPSTPPPAASSGSATSAPSPTGRAPTARPSASSRRCQTAGPTERIYGSSAERTAALPGWLAHYNFTRRHGSLGHRAARSSARRAGTTRRRAHAAARRNAAS